MFGPGSFLSESVVSNREAPQGTVLSPNLFTLYASDFQYNSECHLQKFSDDAAVVWCIKDGQQGQYRQLVDNFVELCRRNHLLNVKKTKQMVVDFTRIMAMTKPITVMGEEVDIVDHWVGGPTTMLCTRKV